MAHTGHDNASEHSERAEPVKAPDPAVAAPLTRTDRLLALQRSAGNKAVGAFVAQAARPGAAAAAARPLARAPTRVRSYRRDGRYAIAGAFDVDFDFLECKLVIRANIVKGRNVSDAELAQVQADTRAAFLRFWDNKFIFTDAATGDDFFLGVDVVYTRTRPHVTIGLRQNRRNPDGTIIDGRDDQTTWFVHSNSNDRAHELSHQLGLRDEYIDRTVRNRRNATAPGVFQDHSLMGNYYNEGIGFAEVKLRHGEQLAADIGRATRRRFTVKLSGPFQGERMVRWRQIWDASAAGSPERAAAEAEIRAIDADMLIPELSAASGVPYQPQYSSTP